MFILHDGWQTYLDGRLVDVFFANDDCLISAEGFALTNTKYFPPDKTGCVGNGSYPDELIVIFPYGSSTLNSLTITHDC